MTGDDLVDLVFITTDHNFMPVTLQRDMASRYIKVWFESREVTRRQSWWRRVLNWVWHWHKPYTYVFNHQSPTTNEWFGYWAIDPMRLIGMYIRERRPSVYDEMAEKQKKLLDAMLKDRDNDEGWRGNEDDL